MGRYTFNLGHSLNMTWWKSAKRPWMKNTFALCLLAFCFARPFLHGHQNLSVVLTAHMLLTTVLRSGILAGMLEKKHTPISHQSSPMRSRSSLSTSHGRLRKYWLAIELHPKTDQVWGNAWSQQSLVYGSPTLAYWASTTAKNIH